MQNIWPDRKISKTRVSDKVLDTLVEHLRSGKLQQGDKLPNEIELARSLGVARSSVREAIRRLVGAGILESSPGRGTIVNGLIDDKLNDDLALSLATAGVRDLYELRILVEGETAARCAIHWTPVTMREIELAHDAFTLCINVKKSRFNANTKFHQAIARASGNIAFYSCLASILRNYREIRELMDTLPQMPEEDLEDHRHILAAIRSRDAALSRSVMQAHLQKNIAKLDDLNR